MTCILPWFSLLFPLPEIEGSHRGKQNRSTKLVRSWALPASFHHATTNPSSDPRNSALPGRRFSPRAPTNVTLPSAALPRWINMTLCHVTWILFLEPFTECAQSVRIRTRYCTWSGLCTESNCAGMYSVHGRVIVDNMHELQQKSKKVKKVLKK